MSLGLVGARDVLHVGNLDKEGSELGAAAHDRALLSLLVVAFESVQTHHSPG